MSDPFNFVRCIANGSLSMKGGRWYIDKNGCSPELAKALIGDFENLRDRAGKAEARLAVVLKGLEAVHSLIEQSGGVYDLHLNGDPAPWSELRQGGAFEDWLRDFDTALDVVRDGDHFAGASKMVCEPYPGAFDGIIGTAEEIARNANCPGDPVPCPRCKGTGTVPRGPQICPTCGHGTTGTCAKNHGPASKHKGCSDWAANTGEAVTHG